MEKVVITAVMLVAVVAVAPMILGFMSENVMSALYAYRKQMELQDFYAHTVVSGVFVSNGIYFSLYVPEDLLVSGVVVQYFNGSVVRFGLPSGSVNLSVFDSVRGVWIPTNVLEFGRHFYLLHVPVAVNVTYVLLITNESGKVVGFSVA